MRIASVVLIAVTLAGCSRHPYEKFFSSGERYLAARKFPEAIIQFENAARTNPESVAAQIRLGDAYRD